MNKIPLPLIIYYDILTKLASVLDAFREQDKTIILQMDFDPMGSY